MVFDLSLSLFMLYAIIQQALVRKTLFIKTICHENNYLLLTFHSERKNEKTVIYCVVTFS